MKITVYTITDCQFSKQEKEYLTSHQLQFEEKNLETNREFLTEMLAVSNNFAGTPVTKIEKDDNQITVLKGFTKEDFDKTLGFEQKASPPPQAVAPAPVAPPVAEPVFETPATPPTPVTVNEPPVAPPVPAVEPPPAPVAPPPAPEAPVAPAAPAAPAQPDPMADILSNLQQQANAAPAPAPADGLPSIPDPKL